MSTGICIKGFAGKDSSEFKKHYEAVMFCIKNDLSFPKETSEFFRGKVDGGDLEDYVHAGIVKYISDGIEIELKTTQQYDDEVELKVADIPKGVDTIIAKFC